MAGRTQGEERSVLARVSQMLAVFSADEPELSARAISSRSRLPRSTVYRLLNELVGLELMSLAPSGAFSIGTRFWELGELSPVSLRLREQSLPFLQQLYEAGGENVHLAVLDGTDPSLAEALYVARLTGPASVPTLSRVGGRHPLHTTGVGKALLMTCDDHWLEQFFGHALQRETVYSVTDETRLRSELTVARTRGYATTRQEMTLGNVSIASPIPPVAGLPQAAIGIVSHLARLDERRMGALLLRTAGAIAKTLTDTR